MLCGVRGKACVITWLSHLLHRLMFCSHSIPGDFIWMLVVVRRHYHQVRFLTFSVVVAVVPLSFFLWNMFCALAARKDEQKKNVHVLRSLNDDVNRRATWLNKLRKLWWQGNPMDHAAARIRARKVTRNIFYKKYCSCMVSLGNFLYFIDMGKSLAVQAWFALLKRWENWKFILNWRICVFNRSKQGCVKSLCLPQWTQLSSSYIYTHIGLQDY